MVKRNMSIFDELTSEIYDWVDGNQNPENIKKDLMHTIEKALAEATERKFKTQLVALLKNYIQMAHGEEAANSLADEGYDKMAESVFAAVDDMMNEVKGYQKAAARLGVDKDECLVFEDSINGLRSGRAAGMKVVGLATTNIVEVIAPLSDIQIIDYRDTDYERLNSLLSD